MNLNSGLAAAAITSALEFEQTKSDVGIISCRQDKTVAQRIEPGATVDMIRADVHDYYENGDNIFSITYSRVDKDGAYERRYVAGQPPIRETMSKCSYPGSSYLFFGPDS